MTFQKPEKISFGYFPYSSKCEIKSNSLLIKQSSTGTELCVLQNVRPVCSMCTDAAKCKKSGSFRSGGLRLVSVKNQTKTKDISMDPECSLKGICSLVIHTPASEQRGLQTAIMV